MNPSEGSSSRNSAKGKGRALPTDVDESTPLLASSSGVEHDLQPAPRRRIFRTLLSVFLLSLCFCILFIALLALLAYSLGSGASGASPEELIERALVVRGPDRVDVLNITSEGGIWVKVRGRIGVDAGNVMGINMDEEDSVLRYWWKSLGQWGIHQVDRVSVNLTTINVTSGDDHLAFLTLSPLELPLTVDPPPDDTWLAEVSLPVYVLPTKNIPTLVKFLRESWQNGTIRVKADVSKAVLRGGSLNDGGWKSWFSVARSHVQSRVQMKIPPLPGLPPPGHNDPLPSPSRLVSLQSFRLTTEDNHVRLYANATAINPAPLTFHYSVPRLPFTVFLPALHDPLRLFPVAAVTTEPFSLTHPNVSLVINGTVVPQPTDASTTISAFLANYISLRDSEVVISSPLFPNVTVDALFPALRPKPQILHNVTIRNMKIVPSNSGNQMVASGTIFARVVLPKGIHVGLNVTRVLPDVLVFDGPVPDGNANNIEHVDGGEPDLPPAPPLPDPLPERAFAHIRPDEWLNASSVRVDADADTGTVVEVLSKITDVPLDVLPGRDREFRNFVGKVIFGSNGAIAGVQGVASVTVRIDGLPLQNGAADEMELDGLPFRSSVRIGKRGMV